MMRGPRFGAALLLIAALHGAVQASSAPSAPAPAALINGQPVSMATLRMLHGVVAQREPEKRLADVLASIVQNQVLADYGRREYGDALLFASARVGFAPDVSAEDGMVATLRMAYRGKVEKALAESAGGSRWVTQRYPLGAERLAGLLGVQRGGVMRLDDRLSPAQEAALRQVPLLDYRFADGEVQTITLQEVWHRQNTQGRNALLALDTELAMRQAQQIVANRYIVHWAMQQPGMNAQVPVELQRILAERDRRDALARYMGAQPDLHFDSPYLKQLQDKVGVDDIAAYYARNPAEFKRIERVEARQLRFADEAAANAASERLAKGEAFEQVARDSSIAASREHGGYLGWISAEQARSDWLAQLLMAWPPGPPSRPVREPEVANGQPGWQIVQVLKRQEGVYPLDSETVRYAARQGLARQWAVRDFMALRERLSQSATLTLDRKALGFGPRALKLAQAAS
ncbi:peptidylprolyl isomerase [Chitinimonas sp.]|uniref:peptidylprolyl isomerase n=1 Tax=Chitinimonas sp. TaxID=1934313 RepID=UPI0035B2E8B7